MSRSSATAPRSTHRAWLKLRVSSCGYGMTSTPRLPRVALGELPLQPAPDLVEVGRDLGLRHSGRARPIARRKLVTVAVVPPGVLLRSQRDRHLDVAHREEEVARRDADDRERLAVQRQAAADDRRIAAEAPLPETVGQHDDLLVAGGVVRAREQAAGRRPGAERLEEVARHAQPGHALRRPVAGEVRVPVAEAGQRRQRLVLVAVVAELRELERVAIGRGVARPDQVEAVRILERQRPQQHAVHAR